MATFKPVIAVFGLTGSIGPGLLDALTSTFKDKYSMPVRALGRDALRHGPTDNIEYYDTGNLDNEETIAKALDGVHVIVDTLSGRVDRTALINAAKKTDTIRLVVPGSFGNMYHDSVFRKYFAYVDVKTLWDNAGFRTATIKVGYFMKWYFANAAPFGLDIENKTFDIYGTGNEKIVWTHESDIARSVASYAYRSPDELPELVRVCGDEISLNDLAELVERKTGIHLDRKYTSKSEQLEISTKTLEANPGQFDMGKLSALIRYASIEDGFFAPGVDNELVNPGLWEWTKVSSVVDETL